MTPHSLVNFCRPIFSKDAPASLAIRVAPITPLCVAVLCFGVWTPLQAESEQADISAEQLSEYREAVAPLLGKYCVQCHGPDTQEADVRLDSLDPDMVAGPDAERWHAALDMINSASMPPDYESQPSDDERQQIVDWMTESLELAADARDAKTTAVARRLTKTQYARSLSALLALPIDFGRNLPDDAKSKMGFTNSQSSLFTSPLHAEYFQSIARQALDRAIASSEQPTPQRYRVTLGKGVGEGGQAAVIGGYQSAPIQREHLRVEILDAKGNLRTASSPTEEAELRQIERNIGIGMRGSSSDRYRIVDDGLLLFSALPHQERVPKSWQGPSPNVKLLLRRCFPTSGPFVLRATVSRPGLLDCEANDGLATLRTDETVARLDAQSGAPTPAPGALVLAASEFEIIRGLQQHDDVLKPVEVTQHCSAELTFEVDSTGYYQVELVHPTTSDDAMPSVSVRLNASAQHLRLSTDQWTNKQRVVTPLAHARLTAGEHKLWVGGRFFVGLSHVVLTPLPEDHPTAVALRNELEQNIAKFRGQNAALRAFLGNRTDDGMEYAEFDRPQEVDLPEGQRCVFEFHGQLDNLPVPIVDESKTNPLSNIMIVGLWNDRLVKNAADSGVPIVVHSIEFEGPYYEAWPPESHRAIFFESPLASENREAYTRAVLARFMQRAFRRSVSDAEIDRYFAFWQSIRGDYDNYEAGVKEVLVAVLCSPHFLYFTPSQAEQPNERILAERLAYFLWNAPPDEPLRKLAREGKLGAELSAQVARMIDDEQVEGMIGTFAEEWLRLDRHASMDVNVRRYPDYTRFVKRDMRLETEHFIKHVLREDLNVLTMIDSDFAMLNQNLAEFYGVPGVKGAEFRPVTVTPDQHRGGLLSQGAFLCGHSDGTQAHPIKRAVWLREKILGSTPPPPPPNVPELDPETPGFDKLTLKEQLELHRNKPSCVDCHRKIDPWGVVFENYDAVGRFATKAKRRPIDAKSQLPDGSVVDGVNELKAYLLESKRKEFVHSLATHLFAYALGRDVSFADEQEIETIVQAAINDDYRFQSLIVALVQSPSFLASGAPTTPIAQQPKSLNSTAKQTVANQGADHE